MIKVEHELHTRRRGRNMGVGMLLIGMIVVVFGLTVVKVLGLSDIRQMERFDHVARPQLEPAAIEAADRALAEQQAAEGATTQEASE